MTDSALIIQWGATAPGRERKAVELFGETLRFRACHHDRSFSSLRKQVCHSPSNVIPSVGITA